MVKINISELEQIFSKVIKKLRLEEEQELIIEEDLYRFIPTDEWTSFAVDVIEIGSLSDDINNLKKMITDNQRPCTFVDFDRLASVLRAISQIKNPV
jgi:hypothetical protein